ncbi:DNA ligase 6 isoform X3 [Spinacia oleracea]|uniref:DNA ligase 6 isoform X3 n=1 Tax=Spinacia oleracea TaxID=3562 RepID=A0A9R0K9H3_SPIOL|nr:DNA ligase 6 isoform X3 [Spinacia oleracea]
MSTAKTLTLNTSERYLQSQNPLPSSSPSQLPSFPANFPPSKLIPKTRFIIDGFRHSGEFSISYFLSHFHADHYTGLTSTWSRGIIFCSVTTARLVVKVLGVSALSVIGLPINETVVIDNCEVTLIDANHCPGAVQFLFKVPVSGGKFERYVHTGDFRFCSDMKLIPFLSEFVGCDAVFLDTTYCDPKFVFPVQEESIDYVVSVIERSRSENRNASKSVLFLVATYVIGKERILLEIARRCDCKIHVDSRKMEILRELGYENEGVFTEDESSSDVHVVGWNVLGETWPYFRPNFMKVNEIMVGKEYKKVVGFVPTGWTYEVKKNKFAVRTKDSFEIHLVPYSEHSNYNELREYVKFLKPKRVLPTVGFDVENVDSKHALKMQKHFAGLVDEMANKQEFLMGFYRVPQGKGKVKVDDLAPELDKDIEQFKEEFDVCELKNGREADSGSTCSVASTHEPDSQDLTPFSDKEKDEIMQELRDCLPVWVSVDQLLELVKTYGRNIVDAVSHFYEHETEFHERSGESLPSSQKSESPCTKLLNPPSVESSLQTPVKSPNQKAKFPPLKQSVASSVSPGKRKKNPQNKKNKKGKLNSNLESGGIKQSTITKFFSKGSRVCQGITATPLSGISTEDKSLTSEHSVKQYKEELEQFIQIIDGSESIKGYAAELLEKAEGNVGLALDMYYNNSEVHLGGNQKGVDASSKSLPCEGLEESISSQGKERSEAGNKVYQSAQDSLADSTAVNYVSLPPETYSPIEHACWKHGQPAPYIHLARTFDIVEGERGKIKATSILSNMFRSLLALSPDDVLPAIYLCTNKIAADHENMELNIGGSLVASALEEACGINRAKIREMYNNFGDLGDVAQECRKTQSLLLPPSPLLIRDVFSILRKISVQTGSGSAGRRKSLIVSMMRSCREKEMKFLVRTLVRNLRIGAMMRTVLPALAQAVALNGYDEAGKVPKELLQGLSAAAVEVYNILPDLNLLVPSLMSEGIKFSTTTLTMVPGIPIRPMLAKITNGIAQALKLFQNKAFTCEFKYDGQRAQIHKFDDGSVRIFSRNGDEMTTKFPDLVHIIQESCKTSAESFIIDAEVVGIDRNKGIKFLSFQELSARERGSKASLVSLDRIKVEADEARPDCEATLTKINAFLEDAFQSSCEGIMVKSLDVDAGYFASKRADSWLKVKRDYMDGVGDSLDLVPIGAWHGNGRKAGWYSPFLMACYNPDTEEYESLCRVMTGFSDAFYKEMKDLLSGDKILTRKPLYYRTDEVPDMWFSAEMVWEIRGADLTVSPVHKAAVAIVHPSRGISMRFPRFVRSLSDRRPEDCSTSTEVAEMFHSQTRKMDLSGAR